MTVQSAQQSSIGGRGGGLCGGFSIHHVFQSASIVSAKKKLAVMKILKILVTNFKQNLTW